MSAWDAGFLWGMYAGVVLVGISWPVGNLIRRWVGLPRLRIEEQGC
jgi:hypothetical protein